MFVPFDTGGGGSRMVKEASSGGVLKRRSSQLKGGLYGVPKGPGNLGIGYIRPMVDPTVMFFFTCSPYGL